MPKLPNLAFLPLALVLHPGLLAAQTESLIEGKIANAREDSHWQFGSLWLTPQFTLQGIYDTNPTNSAVSPKSDVAGTAIPKLSGAIPLGTRALLDFSEQLRFQYYRQNERLRDTFNTSEAGLAIGGKDVLAEGHGELRTELTGPTSEFDVLTRQRTTQADGSLDFALGNRQQLSLGYQYRRIQLTDETGQPIDTLRASRLSRREESVSLRIGREVFQHTTAVAEGTLEYIDFEEPRGSGNARSIEGIGGLEFSPTGRIHGKALLGYKRVEGELGGEEDFAGLVGSINTSVRLGSRTEVEGVYTRDAGPSVLGTPRFFTEERYGGYVTVNLTQRISIRPGVVIGTNSYRVPVRYINLQGQEVEGLLKHRVSHYSLSVARQLTVPWAIALDADYLVRRSDAAVFNKERLTIALSVASRF